MRKIDARNRQIVSELEPWNGLKTISLVAKITQSHPFSWRSDSCYKQIRQTLSMMTAAHCAFCDGLIGVESRETVEHFKPKSQFPELAYGWTNLFPCCDMCQSKKGESFDSALIKPDSEDYEFERYFVANYKTGEIEPSPSLEHKFQLAAEITIRMYGLNKSRSLNGSYLALSRKAV